MNRRIYIGKIKMVLFSVALSLTLVPFFAGANYGADSEVSPLAIKIEKVEHYPELENPFRSSKIWAGTESAGSISLNAEQSLWLFSDTFVNGADGHFSIVNNSASVLEGNSNNYSMDFALPSEQGATVSILKPPSSQEWYWPGASTVNNGDLYVFAKRCRRAGDTKNDEWDFEWTSDELVRLSPADGKPQEWKQTASPLPEDGRKVLFGTACVEDARYLYVYCSDKMNAGLTSPHPAIVTRILRDKLGTASTGDWSYWSEKMKQWCPTAPEATVLIPDASPDMSVTYLPAYKQYVATYISPLTDKILVRTATEPWGPFSEAKELYQCPETKLSVEGKNVLVGGAKEHPELRNTANELIVTYCANPGGIRAHTARPDLFYPRALRVVLAQPESAARP